MKMKRIYSIWIHIKPFIYRLPLFVLMFTIFNGNDIFFSEKFSSRTEILVLLLFFIGSRFLYYIVIKLYETLMVKFSNTYCYTIIHKYFNLFKNKLIVNKKRKSVHIASWAFKVNKIPRNNKDKYALKLFEESEELIKSIDLISKELRKEENIENFELRKIWYDKLIKLNEISKKYNEYKKNL